MSGPPVHSGYVLDVLSQPNFAAELFRAVLDPAVVGLLKLETLQLEDSSFVAVDLREHQGDLLFSVKLRSGGEANLYILFEHKSHPDKGILKQLLKYLYLIHIKQNKMVPVVPIVFYHGPEEWRIPRGLLEYCEVLPEERVVLGSRALDFEYSLVDVNVLDIGELKLSLQHRAFLASLKAKWNFEDQARLGDYLEAFRDLFFDTSHLEFLEKLLGYLYRVQDIEPDALRTLIAERVSEEKKDMALTYVEKLIVQKELETKLEAARNLLTNGVDLEIILKSTGLTREQLREAGIIQN